MNDCKLLELASKAAGMPPITDGNGVFSAWVGSPETGHWWNPLEDDGDALRLAIKLKIGLEFDEDCDSAVVGLDLGVAFCAVAPLCDEGVRRAIVRAAAEIGRQML